MVLFRRKRMASTLVLVIVLVTQFSYMIKTTKKAIWPTRLRESLFINN